ncbi:MAG: sensor histidine kinase, partial [Janthinobacterium lividum]
SRWRRAGLVASFWTAVGVVFALPGLAGGPDWATTLLVSLADWWSWGVIAAVVVALDGYAASATEVRRILFHLALGLGLTLAYLYLSAALGGVLGVRPWSALGQARPLTDALHGRILWSLLVYVLIVGVRQAATSGQRYRAAELQVEKLERSFSEARLAALRMQLDPHFLFNALNTISSEVTHDPKLARRMIEHLGELLRLSLGVQGAQEIPLAEELAFLDHYLAIQRLRFGDRLTIEIRVDPDALAVLVPSLLMQPLVENAIRHGISGRARGGVVRIDARRAGGQLEIGVVDDGVGLPPGWAGASGSGVGLSITRERVLGLHPVGEARFAIGPGENGGTEVTMSFPVRLAPGARHHAAA